MCDVGPRYWNNASDRRHSALNTVLNCCYKVKAAIDTAIFFPANMGELGKQKNTVIIAIGTDNNKIENYTGWLFSS